MAAQEFDLLGKACSGDLYSFEMALVHEAALAFAVFPADGSRKSANGATHLEKLAHQSGTSLSWFTIGKILVGQITLRGKQPKQMSGQKINFVVSSAPTPARLTDRFLKVVLQGDCVRLEGDVYGSVPYYFSLEKGVISNILPVLEVELEVSEESIDPGSLYGFLKYGHTIWDETPWIGIRQGIPNSVLEFRFADGSMFMQKNKIEVPTWRCEIQERSRNEGTWKQLASLNDELVFESLSAAENVLLFLSSGYDSRLILAGISRDSSLRKKTTAITYGPAGSVEVRGAKALANLAGVKWRHVNPPEDFLQSEYLERTHSIFGSSLHMHGMYQIALVDRLKKLGVINDGTVIATGFMSGVPTGQHVTKAKASGSGSLDRKAFLDSFSQSQYWTEFEISRLFGEGAEDHLVGVVSKLNGIPLDDQLSIAKQSILLDLWTRQRSFISYHPRVMEFSAEVASPHMNRRWLEFFMTAEDMALKNRRLVQDLFRTQYPALATVPSNSEYFGGTGTRVETFSLFLSRALSSLGASDAFVARFGDQPIRFDENAFRVDKNMALSPLPLYFPSWLNQGVIDAKIRDLAGKRWHSRSYGSLVSAQSVAFSLARSESL